MSINRTECVTMLKNAGVQPAEAENVVKAMLEKKASLAAEGKLTNAEADLAKGIQDNLAEARIETILKRKQAALTILKRKEAENFIANVKAQNFGFMDGLEALLVGSMKRFDGARNSIDARGKAIIESYHGQLMNGLAEIEAKYGGDNIAKKLIKSDKVFQHAVITEMLSPGASGNKMTGEVGELFSMMLEEARIRANSAGANIGKLDGYVPQTHDRTKISSKLHGGVKGWREFIEPLLSKEKTFGNMGQEEIEEFLNTAGHHIIAGDDLKISFADESGTPGPKNIASGMAKHRALHFKDAESFLLYQERYGQGNVLGNIINSLDRSARKIALMEGLGPNPQAMVEGLMAREMYNIDLAVARKELEIDVAAEQKDHIERAFKRGGVSVVGRVSNWMAELTGETSVPGVGNVVANLSRASRNWESLIKLAGATISQLGDIPNRAINARANGMSFWGELGKSMVDYFNNLPKIGKYNQKETLRLARDLGQHSDNMLGAMLQRWEIQDGSPGATSRLMNTMFKWTGMNFVTEAQKTGYAFSLSKHIGDARGMDLASLDGPRKALMEYHGINAEKWELLRGLVEEHKGNQYFNPALAKGLEDAQLEGLLPDYFKKPPKGGDDIEIWQTARAKKLEGLRREISTDAISILNDETGFAIIETDARARASITQGTKAGTVPGEVWRHLMQFKSFPIAQWQRTIGGRRWVRGDKQAGMRYGWGNGGAIVDAVTHDTAGLIQYAITAATFGYISMTAKDISNNKTPRELNSKTILAAFAQSGGLGIFGDFLFSQQSRFGNSLTEMFTPPVAQDLGQIYKFVKTERDAIMDGDWGKASDAKGDMLKLGMRNIPFINMWYTRAAANALFMDAWFESISPGYKKRQERLMKREYGQERLW